MPSRTRWRSPISDRPKPWRDPGKTTQNDWRCASLFDFTGCIGRLQEEAIDQIVTVLHRAFDMIAVEQSAGIECPMLSLLTVPAIKPGCAKGLNADIFEVGPDIE